MKSSSISLPSSASADRVPAEAVMAEGLLLPQRRRFLKGLAVAAAAGLTAPLWAAEAPMEAFWYQPRRLRLYRTATQEYVEAVYFQDGRLVPEGYGRLCHLLRDTRAGVVYPMDPRLLDLLCAMQAWVAPYGYTAPIHINSGYRTPQTNAGLEGAARASMHLKGCAADVVLPGLPAVYVGHLAARYAAGGVGFYVDRGFIHVDTGRRRFWVR